MLYILCWPINALVGITKSLFLYFIIFSSRSIYISAFCFVVDNVVTVVFVISL